MSSLFILSCCSARHSLPIVEGGCAESCVDIRCLCWRDFFDDPDLQQLITLALYNNRDLRVARLRVQGAPFDLATREDLNAAALRLIGQVANTYLMEAEINELICITKQTIQERQEINRIVKLSFEEGAAAKFDLLAADSFLQEAASLLVGLQRKRDLNWNAQTLLVGFPICAGNHLLSEVESYFRKEICSGTFTELLCNRPDVLSAKYRSCNMCLSQVESKIAFTEYEHTIQSAYREIGDALADHAWFTEQIFIQKSLLDELTERFRLAWLRFMDSTSPFLEVIDAEREKFSAAQGFVQTQRALLASEVNLYTALGGGYEF